MNAKWQRSLHSEAIHNTHRRQTAKSPLNYAQFTRPLSSQAVFHNLEKSNGIEHRVSD